MDFVEGFWCINKIVILIVVDHLSKVAHFIPLGHPYMVVSVTHAFFNEIARLYGLPASIISDRDPFFANNL